MSEPSDIVGSDFADRYKVLRKIDEGGMGAVYEARHRFTDERVALKVLHQTKSLSPLKRERFLREAGASSKIDHPGIVRVLDAGETSEGQLYLAMEFLEGQNLHDLYFTKGLSSVRAVEIIMDALSALEAAHARGLVHRDIKPANLFLTQKLDGTEEVKLLDFGLIRADTVTGVQTHQGAVMGTVRFMSPEQASGGEVDVRSDVWSMGATLHQLITGRAPFEDTPNEDLFRLLLVDDPPSAQTVDARQLCPSLVEAIDVSLKRRPSERWQSAGVMRTVLEQALLDLRDEEASRRARPEQAFEPTVDVEQSEYRVPVTNLEPASNGGIVAEAEAVPSSQSQGRKWLALASAVIILISVASVFAWSQLRVPASARSTAVDGVVADAAEESALTGEDSGVAADDVAEPKPVGAEEETRALRVSERSSETSQQTASREPNGEHSPRAQRRARRQRRGNTSAESVEPVKPEPAPQAMGTQSELPGTVSFRAVNPGSIAAQEREAQERPNLESRDTPIIRGECVLGCSRENTRCVLRAARLTGRDARETRIECARTNAACRRACGF